MEEKMYSYKYPHPAVATDCVIFGFDGMKLKILLIQRGILRMAMSKLRERIHFQPIGFDLLPEKFTLKELQLLYEAILGVHFDRRNFAKKMLHLDILTQLDETVWPTPKRKAFLFSFNEDKYKELKQKGFRLEF